MPDQTADVSTTSAIEALSRTIWKRKFRKKICIIKKKCWTFDGSVRVVENRETLYLDVRIERHRKIKELTNLTLSIGLPKVFSLMVGVRNVRIDGRRVQFDILIKACADLPIIGSKCVDLFKKRIALGRLPAAEVLALGLIDEPRASEEWIFFEEKLSVDDLTAFDDM